MRSAFPICTRGEARRSRAHDELHQFLRLVPFPWTSERAAATPNTAKSCEEGKNSPDRENCEITEALSGVDLFSRGHYRPEYPLSRFRFSRDRQSPDPTPNPQNPLPDRYARRDPGMIIL